MSLLWINGRLIDKADAKVSPFDHGLLYGDGVWEPLRIHGGKLFRPEEHFHYLSVAAATLGIEVPLARAALIEAIESTIRANNRTEGYIRVIVTRGPGTLGPDPRKIDPQVIIIVEEYHPFPSELYEHGLHAVTYTVPHRDVRVLGVPETVLAKRFALERGCLEAILAGPEGKLVGSIEGMLFLMNDGALVVAGGHIPDVAGNAVAAIAGESGIVVVEYAVTLDDVLSAGEAFIAGTSCGVICVVRVDERVIGSGGEGPITRQLRQRYLAMTRGGG